jgi:1-acyl-sn-glycerol-3-phosphate acyltransferase
MDGRIGKIRPGVTSITRRVEAEVVPAVIDGAYEAWPRHRKMFSFHPIRVIFGAPVGRGRTGEMDDEEFTLVIERRLKELQRELRRR